MVEISRELAIDLLDDVSELLNGIIELRQYERYKKRCIAYEAEINQLRDALLKDESDKNERIKLS